VLAHSWDLASIGGRTFRCGDEQRAAGLVAARLVGPRRDPQQYGPELVVDPDAPLERRFLAYLGRA